MRCHTAFAAARAFSHLRLGRLAKSAAALTRAQQDVFTTAAASSAPTTSVKSGSVKRLHTARQGGPWAPSTEALHNIAKNLFVGGVECEDSDWTWCDKAGVLRTLRIMGMKPPQPLMKQLRQSLPTANHGVSLIMGEACIAQVAHPLPNPPEATEVLVSARALSLGGALSETDMAACCLSLMATKQLTLAQARALVWGLWCCYGMNIYERQFFDFDGLSWQSIEVKAEQHLLHLMDEIQNASRVTKVNAASMNGLLRGLDPGYTDLSVQQCNSLLRSMEARGLLERSDSEGCWRLSLGASRSPTTTLELPPIAGVKLPMPLGTAPLDPDHCEAVAEVAFRWMAVESFLEFDPCSEAAAQLAAAVMVQASSAPVACQAAVLKSIVAADLKHEIFPCLDLDDNPLKDTDRFETPEVKRLLGVGAEDSGLKAFMDRVTQMVVAVGDKLPLTTQLDVMHFLRRTHSGTPSSPATLLLALQSGLATHQATSHQLLEVLEHALWLGVKPECHPGLGAFWEDMGRRLTQCMHCTGKCCEPGSLARSSNCEELDLFDCISLLRQLSDSGQLPNNFVSDQLAAAITTALKTHDFEVEDFEEVAELGVAVSGVYSEEDIDMLKELATRDPQHVSSPLPLPEAVRLFRLAALAAGTRTAMDLTEQKGSRE